jgi:phosphoribosyl-dephospho-CoA transferase
MPEEIVGSHTDAWQRHDLVHVVPSAWATALAAHSLGQVPLLTQWADRGWPVIVRRRLESEALDIVPVGVPLPLAAGKSRIALNVPPAAVIARAAPPSLRIVAHKADPGWQPTIAALISLGERHGIEPAAFGSLLCAVRFPRATPTGPGRGFNSCFLRSVNHRKAIRHPT